MPAGPPTRPGRGRAATSGWSAPTTRAGADEHDADPLADVLADVLTFPAGSSLPPVPDLERFDPPAPRDPQLAAVLRDAVANARVDWD